MDQYAVLARLATAKLDEYPTFRLQVELRFTDAPGIRWLRDNTGHLASIPSFETTDAEAD